MSDVSDAMKGAVAGTAAKGRDGAPFLVAALSPGRTEERYEDKHPRYTEAEAVTEANRCLYCVDAPCIKACPTEIDIPTFIHKISTGNVRGAARTILTANLLGQSCGQVCPVEVLCAGSCVYNTWDRDPIRIGRLQRYAVETALEKNPALFQKKAPTGKRIACIGAGPASLAVAGWLALEGHRAVIFERKPLPGGLNTLGVAPYKMKADESLGEIEWLLSLGDIELRHGVSVAAEARGPHEIAARSLLEEYDAVFLGLGLGDDSQLNIPGEEGEGVVGAVAFVERLKVDPALAVEGVRRAAVIGGGNTALDVAHELALLGVDVSLIYRRGRAAMTGYAHELDSARVDGARLVEDRAPVEVLREDGRVVGVRLARTEGGRPVAGGEEVLPVDLVAVSIGQSRATQVALAFEGVALDGRGRLLVDEATGRTGNPRVWSGGDCVNGGDLVVTAVADGKRAARSIHAALVDATSPAGA
ncbi:FAD-dependent oxidoreductase [Chondromyces apiculatus]|uniref:Pyridine nucleotide-disulfide oxidoreductase associated with reductive pyrimidine catabolism n=1 Tax=Chondromyces apiculatus DSM 436 TaxID=1192034 RepID=A0A017SW08_9BACT|nr:FAD-dependent oxidoreductase [Chondromyces apiculatus]EYF01163.1 Pyridine nucleotide-disulfide oxidoreductase associated with reductive pyrimidine catabolism [Chondromyces apiculatus DSM 436]